MVSSELWQQLFNGFIQYKLKYTNDKSLFYKEQQ